MRASSTCRGSCAAATCSWSTTSATLPAALSAAAPADGTRADRCTCRRPIAGRRAVDWVVELRARRRRASATPRCGERLALAGGGARRARRALPRPPARLWVAALRPGRRRCSSYLAALGRPHPLRRHGAPRLAPRGLPDRLRPGAGQRRDALRGTAVHAAGWSCGWARGVWSPHRAPHRLSSLELGERPYPERYRVPPATAARVNAARAAGGPRDRRRDDRDPGAGDAAARRDGPPAAGWTCSTITPSGASAWSTA